MINFIICEDEKVLATKYKNEIDKFMMKYDYEYNCQLFYGYTKKFKEYAQEKQNFKIYLLDIKTEEGSGLDAARYIREELDDWTSMIIIITSYNEYKFEALGKRLMLVDFINKLDNCIEHLHKDLAICVKHYDNRPKSLKYIYKNMAHNIDYKQIVYIDKEQDSKRCIIHLINKDIVPYQGTINNLIEILDERFVKISRSTIINSDHINKYDLRSNKIEFKNGETTEAISRDKKRGIVDYVRGVY